MLQLIETFFIVPIVLFSYLAILIVLNILKGIFRFLIYDSVEEKIEKIKNFLKKVFKVVLIFWILGLMIQIITHRNEIIKFSSDLLKTIGF